jgi:hypothetical protein
MMMDMTVIHIFFIITTVVAKPVMGDLYEYTFRTMQECREYVDANPQAIADAVEEIRPLISIPDDVPFKIAYGCRGKESI